MKRPSKPYWEMTLPELREATKEFDEEFVADKSRALTADEKALWEEIRDRARQSGNGSDRMTIAIHMEKTLLDRCNALAKKKRISRDALIARGVKALLVAEGEA
jgi:hypothetical protein